MLALRSVLFNVVMWLSILVYAPASLLTFPFPARARYRFIKQWARFHIWLLRHLCRLDYRVEGRENLPHEPAVILSKHQSAWETLAYQLIFPPFSWVLKRELIWIPLFGWALALMQPIAITRGSGRRAIDQVIKQGTSRLASGVWVLIFPEGTRMPPGRRGRYRIGGAMLACASGHPVVPVAHNGGTYWPRRGFMKNPGVVQVVIGPTIASRGRKPEEVVRIAEQWIESTMARLEGRQTTAQTQELAERVK